MGLLTKLRNRLTTERQQIDWGRTALLVALILAVFAALWQWAMPEIRTITSIEFRAVPQIHRVESVKRVNVPCPESGIVVLDKAAVAKKMPLLGLSGGDITAWQKQDREEGISPAPAGTQPNTQVTATADIPQSDNGVEIVSLIDLQTGESQIVAKEKAAPWFQFRNDAAAGIRYGLNQRLENSGSVYGRWDFLRVKDVYLSGNVDVTTGGDAHLQLGAEYRW
ncbi:hypothetical protein KI809_18785 [Geobacter pelophilus]|uniref:Outer membrane protein beta-barrel domain-containing protein n=1 Tax=Geoanaerobacter pelophilus TaxID=60036 RepID=A0AAW4L6E3_9BACT|nr:hypothetical protein [Geoanaerobacter pelophilus]MBT0666359.1 hypothetical protein [Geoanaerobacter pelophilus]